MNRIAMYALAGGIVALSATIEAALPVSEIPVMSLRQTGAGAQPVMNNADCAATAAVHRAACLKPANPGSEQRKVQCEDAVNLRQRVCMIEVLEALHPGLIPAPAAPNIPAPAAQNIPAPAAQNIPAPAAQNIPASAAQN